MHIRDWFYHLMKLLMYATCTLFQARSNIARLPKALYFDSCHSVNIVRCFLLLVHMPYHFRISLAAPQIIVWLKKIEMTNLFRKYSKICNETLKTIPTVREHSNTLDSSLRLKMSLESYLLLPGRLYLTKVPKELWEF